MPAWADIAHSTKANPQAARRHALTGFHSALLRLIHLAIGHHSPFVPECLRSPLEASSKIPLSSFEGVPADERAGEFQERFVNVATSIKTNSKTTERV